MGMLSVSWHERLALIHIDDPNDKVNTLGRELLDEMPAILTSVAEAEAVIIISGKKDCFVAGADIDLFPSLTEPGQAAQLAKDGQTILDQIAAFSVPVIAAIKGAALGGGLELALACHYRICADDGKTVMGLPEVKLGLLPGLGGTQRLPRLIGLRAALDLLLTGRNVYPRKAKSLGLADKVFPAAGFEEAALKFARDVVGSPRPKRKPKKGFLGWLLEGNPLGRSLVYRGAHASVMAKTAGNYPAPLAIIDTVKRGLTSPLTKGLEQEANQFDRLVRSPESKALVQLFFGMNASKKNPHEGKARTVNQIGILGAGLMGSGIAEVTIPRGIQAFMKDLDQKAIGRGEQAVWKSFEKKVKRRIISQFQRQRTMSHLRGVTDYQRMGKVDVVIEAVFEDLELKRKMLADVEANCPEHCIFASNTSSLPIAGIAQHAARPGQVIGMHYFSPVAKMPLLEIVVTPQTEEWVLATAIDLGIAQGKNIIVVQDGPGFYTTRILGPLLNEAVVLLEEGAAVEQIDKAMFTGGFPLGPIKLLDEVGIDVGAHVGSVLQDLFQQRTGELPTQKIRELYGAGYKGRKNGKGFYDYGGKKSGKRVNTDIYRFFGGSTRKTMPMEEIQDRLLLIMINEAAWCLEEKIIGSPRDGDLGAILGLGFPPFLGGPFHYMDQQGPARIAERMQALADKHGKRFVPAPIIRGTERFHPED